MTCREELFSYKDIYNLKATENLFVGAMAENVEHHIKNCKFYADFLASQNFSPESILSIEDCFRIPTIHVNFFKRNEILSLSKEQFEIHATSSGTQGQKTQAFFDADSLKLGTRMVIQRFRHHKLISILPTRYAMLMYEPASGNEMGAIKTAMGTTRFAPSIGKTFMLQQNGNEYILNRRGMEYLLKKAHKSIFPTRFVGFPAYMYQIVSALKADNLRFQLNPNSMVFLGGGWKQFSGSSVNKEELYALIEETLGIPQENCRDFYSAVEHSIAYIECKNRHFHVPIWSRALIRDVKTLEPLPYGQVGFLSFLTPLMCSAPLCSVTMGDLAVMQEGKACGCGIDSPYFEVLGRAGLGMAKNCAVSASEILARQGGQS